MFTGLIEDLGILRDIRTGTGQAVLTVGTALPMAEFTLGESIAINGVCLTVTRFAEGAFSADVSPETLDCTTLGRLSAGSRVNLERALRPIPLGRKNWLFCWTEVGAQHAGIVQSLITTCRLHGIEPYTYFVDVLQRVGQHPARRVAELTPRLWKQHFAEQPMRSDLHGTAL